jgi:hypothetical protein
VKAAGKFLKRRALSLFFLRKIRQSTMRTTAIAFAGEIRVLDSTGKLERTIAFSEKNRKLSATC